MTQLHMFGQNIFLILGALILLVFGSIGLVAAYMALRIWYFHHRQRRARQEYRRRTLRADGKRYPPIAGGTCQVCGRVSTTIYYPTSGEKLCAPCYEEFWRRTEYQSPNADSQTASEPPQLTTFRR